jgi:hypothetical protein
MMVAPIPSREPVVHDITPVFEEVVEMGEN